MNIDRMMKDVPKNYSKLDEESFKEMVLLDVKGKLHENLVEDLKKDPQKWYSELVRLYNDICLQLQQRKVSDKEYSASLLLNYSKSESQKRWAAREKETAHWKKGANRYKASLMEKLQEVKPLAKKAKHEEQQATHEKPKSEASLERVKLKKAIAEIADILRKDQTPEELEQNRDYILRLIERTVNKSIKEMFANQDRKDKQFAREEE